MNKLNGFLIGVAIVLFCLFLFGCGDDGRDGIDGTQGIQGVAGAQGRAGDKGDKGDTGAKGDQGVKGADGTNITVVKFCKDTPSYPTTFPEVGLCINNQLFAVYSANDGFLTLIPPGNYLSNAIGSNCNFTVKANCIVE
jgi:hypothetical protein